MLEDLSADQLTEWLAFESIQAKEQKKAELAAKAQHGVQNHKRRGKR